jgi:hypothetical protein
LSVLGEGGLCCAVHKKTLQDTWDTCNT